MRSVLQERHPALISAAVTGKIDVLHWQSTEEAQRSEISTSSGQS
jgi:hypothetical protein